MRRKTLIALFGVFLILIVVVSAGWLYLRTSLPQTGGSHTVDGLTGPVEIVRDPEGIPHIHAGTDHDAFFALGYLHAQDRSWQLEMNRRAVNGQLSQILGEPAVEIDKFLRTLGVHRAARLAWERIEPPSQATLQAYVDGINAWIGENHTLPPEFLILDTEPTPWTVYDPLAWSKIMAWDFSSGFYARELLRTALIQALGPERAAPLLVYSPDDSIQFLDVNQLSQTAGVSHRGLLDIDAVLQSNLQLGDLNAGSNAWVISGRHTESGLPLLANDIHTSATIPSIWYLAEVQGDRLHASGATLVGFPAVVIGHNAQIAWGVTAFTADIQDLYIERINPDNPNQYEANGTWRDMEIFEEVIEVKDEEQPIRWAARGTRHGPLISDLDTAATSPVALRWTALDAGDTTIDALLGINYATDWPSFREALRSVVAPTLDYVYADTAGNLGHNSSGRVPIRATGQGSVPVPGWTDEFKWIDRVPFDEMPSTFNPESGYLFTANHRLVNEDYPYFLSSDWEPRYRAKRISERLEALISSGNIDTADMAELQADGESIFVRELLPYFLSVSAADERHAEALAYLGDWDGLATRESVAATIFEAWSLHIGSAIFEDELHGDLYERLTLRTYGYNFSLDVLAEPELYRSWCEDVLLAPAESCVDTARAALDKALDELEDRLGTNMERWKWGTIHRTQFEHTPFSQVPVLRRIFHRSIANGNSTYAVNLAASRLTEPHFEQYALPSYRHIIDLGELAGARYMTATGQSGNLLSAHYDDFIQRHRDVDYLPMTFERETARGKTLMLQPR